MLKPTICIWGEQELPWSVAKVDAGSDSDDREDNKRVGETSGDQKEEESW